MSLNFLHYVLFLFVAVELNASTAVLPSSTVQTSSLPATSSATSTALPGASFTAVPSPSLSSLNIASTSPVKPHVSTQSSSVQPTSNKSLSPPSVPQGTIQPTSIHSEPGRIGKPVSLVLGFVLAYVALATAFVIYYIVVGTGINRETRKELTEELSPSDMSEEAVRTQVQDGQDAGITHEAFVEDSDRALDGSTNVAAPDQEVKIAENDDFACEVTSF